MPRGYDRFFSWVAGSARAKGEAARSLIDFIGIKRRIDARAARWVAGYRDYLKSDGDHPPLPPVVQIIPTERCNLRCPMCNQWGERGYFGAGKRDTSHMPIADAIGFLDRYQALQGAFTLSVHGGEPFVYRYLPKLLDYLGRARIDTFFTTNGTLLQRHVSRLGRINRHVFYLISLDGGEPANDQIRGRGVTRKILDGVTALREECLRQRTGHPKIIVNFCLSEHNTGEILNVLELAKRVGALIVNYNFRWFLPEEKGREYDEILQREFGVRPTGAWTGWITHGDFAGMESACERLYPLIFPSARRLTPPFVTTIPKGLTREQAVAFFRDHDELFGISRCIMPSYWARIHSNGDLVYCPGHPDIVPGNVFKESFKDLFVNSLSVRLRRRVEEKLLPVCNRCCGLFMPYTATKRLGGVCYPQSPAR